MGTSRSSEQASKQARGRYARSVRTSDEEKEQEESRSIWSGTPPSSCPSPSTTSRRSSAAGSLLLAAAAATLWAPWTGGVEGEDVGVSFFFSWTGFEGASVRPRVGRLPILLWGVCVCGCWGWRGFWGWRWAGMKCEASIISHGPNGTGVYACGGWGTERHRQLLAPFGDCLFQRVHTHTQQRSCVWAFAGVVGVWCAVNRYQAWATGRGSTFLPSKPALHLLAFSFSFWGTATFLLKSCFMFRILNASSVSIDFNPRFDRSDLDLLNGVSKHLRMTVHGH
jgi:hypothetical protein